MEEGGEELQLGVQMFRVGELELESEIKSWSWGVQTPMSWNPCGGINTVRRVILCDVSILPAEDLCQCHSLRVTSAKVINAVFYPS